MDNARVHTARETQETLDVSRFKGAPQPLFNPDIAPSDFFFSVGEDELYEVMVEILTGVSIEMIETVFVDWMNRLQRLIDGNGDYVS
jgi:hypothetical protein